MVKVDHGVSLECSQRFARADSAGGHRKRVETPLSQSPQTDSSPSFGTASTPLLGNTAVNAAANPDPLAGAAAGLLAPVTGTLGSTAGTLKGVLGTTTGTLNGLLGSIPLGPLVGTVGGIGNGVLDKVGTIGTGQLGLGTILKPIGDTLNGLPLVGPIVGPVAGGLAGTVGGLSVSQFAAPTPQFAAPTPNVSPQLGQYGQFAGNTMATATEVQETIVGRLADGRLVTNTGRLLGVADTGGVGEQVPGSGPPFQPPTGLDDAGQTLRPITSNPAIQGPISGLPGLGDLNGAVGRAGPQLGSIGGQLGNIGGAVPQFGYGGTLPQAGNIGGTVPQLGNIGGGALPLADLGRIVANLPPGLGQILQPIGSADKYLQVGNQLVPLGNLDAGQLAQLGLDRLPVTPVNPGFGYPSVNYIQDGEAPEDPATDPQSKEVRANPVTSWMDGGNSTSTDPVAFPTPDNSTMPITAPETPMPDDSAVPLSTKSQMPMMAEQLQVQPLELAPPTMASNQTVAGKPHSIIKGDNDPWYDVKIDGGDTFQRIAAEMSGQEKNYYGGGARDPDTTGGPSGVVVKSAGQSGWHEISSSSRFTQASATGTMTSSSTFAAPTPAPTPAPEDDAGTFAWSEDWGDWVSADYDDDSGLQVGWDGVSTFPASASATTSVPNPTSSTMSGNTSAGLS